MPCSSQRATIREASTITGAERQGDDHFIHHVVAHERREILEIASKRKPRFAKLIHSGPLLVDKAQDPVAEFGLRFQFLGKHTARGLVPTINIWMVLRPRFRICLSMKRITRRLNRTVPVLTDQNRPRNLGLEILGMKKLPTTKSATVASEVASKTSTASVCWPQSRLDSYRSRKENNACQSTTRAVNSTKLRTEIRMARNSAKEIALMPLRLGREATRKEPTRSVESKSLNRIKRTERRVMPTLTPLPFLGLVRFQNGMIGSAVSVPGRLPVSVSAN